MGFEGLGDLMRSRCLSQETPKPRRFSAEASLRRGAFSSKTSFARSTLKLALSMRVWRLNTCSTASFTSSIGIRSPRAIWF